VEVADVAAVLETARRRGLEVSTRAGVAAVELCGVRFELIAAPSSSEAWACGPFSASRA
jgi:hypothetical protein